MCEYSHFASVAGCGATLPHYVELQHSTKHGREGRGVAGGGSGGDGGKMMVVLVLLVIK